MSIFCSAFYPNSVANTREQTSSVYPSKSSLGDDFQLNIRVDPEKPEFHHEIVEGSSAITAIAAHRSCYTKELVNALRTDNRRNLLTKIDVHVQGGVGRDHYGHMVKSLLGTMGPNTDSIKECYFKRTNVNIHLIRPNGEERIRLNPAETLATSTQWMENFSFIPESVDKRVHKVFIPGAVVISTEFEEKVFDYILKTAARERMKVCLGKVPSYGITEDQLKLINYLVVTEEELQIFPQCSQLEKMFERGVELVGLGVEHVIITKGHTKATYFWKGGSSAYLCDFKENHRKGNYNAIERDTFTATFAAGITEHRAGNKGAVDSDFLGKLVRNACAAAALVGSRDGAPQDIIPWSEEIEAFS
ncbi:Ribokinase-like protein [Colletotrichum lupini]|nr:Ribokinase-like protein [Colletotrichum lupini]